MGRPRVIVRATALLIVLLVTVSGPARAPDARAETPPHPGPGPLSALHPGSPPALERLQRGALLVAAPGLPDPNFAHTVVLLIDHGRRGSFGVILNVPTGVPLEAIVRAQDEPLPREAAAIPVYLGGPVARERILFLVRTPEGRLIRPGARPVTGDIHATGDLKAVLRVLERGDGSPSEAPSRPPPPPPGGSEAASGRARAYVGSAGWAPGQLAAEVLRGSWRVLDPDPDEVFGEGGKAQWRRLREAPRGTWAEAGTQGEAGHPAPNLPGGGGWALGRHPDRPGGGRGTPLSHPPEGRERGAPPGTGG